MKWAIDPAHSQIQFAVKHLGISTVRGTFQQFSGVKTQPTLLSNCTVTAGTSLHQHWFNLLLIIHVVASPAAAAQNQQQDRRQVHTETISHRRAAPTSEERHRTANCTMEVYT